MLPDLIIGRKLEPLPISVSIDAFDPSTGARSARGPRAPKGIKTALYIFAAALCCDKVNKYAMR